MAESGAIAGLCPITEANLGDGIFAAKAYLEAGGRFGVGSDSQIEINAPGELRPLEYSQRLSHRARNVLSTRAGNSTGRELYDRALAGGAQALARPGGALPPCSLADIVVLDRDHPNLAHGSGDRWLDAYLFSSAANAVRDVFVASRDVVSNGRHRDRERIEQAYKRVLARIGDI
jgi:cytosine/adenosine deaminase-related metal-dependent hydrolase